MRNVWFTSDTHFGHLKIPLYSKREFCFSESELETAKEIWENRSHRNTKWTPSIDSIIKMDDHLIDQINKHVDKDDILWHLGDFCFWKKTNFYNFSKSYREKINCKNVFLVRGNHDPDEIEPVFEGFFNYKEIKVQSKNIVLSHYSHCFWNKSHYGSWMLYGHAHGSAENWLDEHMPQRLSMDVGVDNAFKILGEYRPFSFQEISSIIGTRKGYNIDCNSFSNNVIPRNNFMGIFDS